MGTADFNFYMNYFVNEKKKELELIEIKRNDIESGRRLKEWLADFKKVHPYIIDEETHESVKNTNSAIAKNMDYTPEHLSNVISGKRTLTVDMALSIFRHTDIGRDYTGGVIRVRPEWLLCIDDYKTELERIDAINDQDWNDARTIDTMIKRLFESKGLSIKLVDLNQYEEDKPYGKVDLLYYSLINAEDTEVGQLSVPDYVELKHEILHYSGYLVSKILKKKNLLK